MDKLPEDVRYLVGENKAICSSDGVKIYGNGQELSLNRKKALLFYILVEAASNGKKLTNQEIQDKLDWPSRGSSAPDSQRTCVSELKKKLKPFCLEILHEGNGYHISQKCVRIPSQSEQEEAAQKGNERFQAYFESLTANIHLTTKKANEGPNAPSFADRADGCDHLTVMNFAATSFFASESIAKAYELQQATKIWFYEHLDNQSFSATVVLLNPHSAAARDAANHKMNPPGQSVSGDDIINRNIWTVLDYKKKFPKADIHLFLTDISLPYGITAVTSFDQQKNTMKIDLYSPHGSPSNTGVGGDGDRPSFILRAKDPQTASIYRVFDDAISYILDHSKEFTGPDIAWLTNQTIVHRGRYDKAFPEHAISGYWQCIKHNLPIEVDILPLRDGTLIVGRDETLKSRKYPENSFKLSGLSLSELRSLSSAEYYGKDGKNLKFRLEELMTLAEFLGLINGNIPVLIELKLEEIHSPQVNRNNAVLLVKRFMECVRYYTGTYAVCSANPYVLEAVHKADPCTAIGQISWSFAQIPLPDYYLKIHKEFTFNDIVKPDFISYKLSEIPNNDALTAYCKANNIPLLAWVAQTADDKALALENGCLGLLVEADPSLY